MLNYKSQVNLKRTIWIEGFNTALQRDNRILELLPKIGEADQTDPILYWQKTSDIEENIAKIFVEQFSVFTPMYRAYDKSHSDYYETAIESIKSACPYKWCIIYTKNE